MTRIKKHQKIKSKIIAPQDVTRPKVPTDKGSLNPSRSSCGGAISTKKTHTEQTVLAKMFGLSNKSFRRMLHHAKFDTEENFKIIDGKRHYKMKDVIEVLKKAK